MVFRLRDVKAEQREDMFDEYEHKVTMPSPSPREDLTNYSDDSENPINRSPSDSSKNLNSHSTRRRYEHRQRRLLKRDQKNGLVRSVGSFRYKP